jgi:hypothetical protein
LCTPRTCGNQNAGRSSDIYFDLQLQSASDQQQAVRMLRDEEIVSQTQTSASSNYSTSTSTSMRSKHESRDFSGSVFLISSDGRMLSLPIPTRSPRDPLNWSKMKRARAFIAIFFFSILGLFLVQGPSLMFVPLRQEFSDEVYYTIQNNVDYLLILSRIQNRLAWSPSFLLLRCSWG